jgi:hypothetical protein
MMTEQRPTVFITEGRSLDFSPATVYGKIHVMELGRPMPYTEGLPNHLAVNSALITRIKKELSNYIPGLDLVCPTGAPVIMTAVGVVLGSINGRHRMLGWDNFTRRYIEYVVEGG